VWLDATAETCAYGDIPYSDRGVQGLIVGDGKGEFKTIPATSADNGARCPLAGDTAGRPAPRPPISRVTMRGESGQGLRLRCALSDSGAAAGDDAQDWRSALPTALSQDLSLTDGIDKTGPFVFKMSTTAPNFAEQADDLLTSRSVSAETRPRRIPIRWISAPGPLSKRTLRTPHRDDDRASGRYVTGNVPVDLNMSTRYKSTIARSRNPRTGGRSLS